MSEQPSTVSSPTIQTVLQWMRKLKITLERRGFAVTAGHWYLDVTNPATEPDEHTDPTAIAFASARLKQRVQLAYREGVLAWYWEWSGPTRDAGGEYEYLAAPEAIDEVAERITRVLAPADGQE